MLLEIGLFKKQNKTKAKKQKQGKEKKGKEKKNKNCIKSGLSQFLFLQQKM